MFTGIIREIGIVEKSGKKVRIHSRETIRGKKIGDSISVNGVCTTINALGKDYFDMELMQETIETTTLGSLKKDQRVNLEPAAKLNDSLDGHFVLGHVDTKGKVIQMSKGTLKIEFPERFGKYMAWKGPITINGVNLTITDLELQALEVKLIPHTAEHTTLEELQKGDEVNLEVDIIAKYLERMLDSKDKQATYEFLKERNLI